jgi:CDP-glucose 4,6-dehydratase
VIGGGDWAQDRLVPDLARAVAAGQPLQIRSPAATRPWQHVLDSLSGYLTLGQRLVQGEKAMADAWNFGPGPEANQTVAAVLARMAATWPALTWEEATAQQPHEARLLYLDSSKARAQLRWRPVWTLEEALTATAEWYRAAETPAAQMSRSQLDRYVAAARVAGLEWAAS